MKTKVLALKVPFILFFFILVGKINAQVYPIATTLNGYYAPGTEMTIPEHLAQGKHIIIDLFDVHCEDCFSYLQTGELNQFYSTYGPDGSDEVVVFAYEIDDFTGENQIANSIPGTTAGDWDEYFTYPFMEGGFYELFFGFVEAPAVLWICPNGTMTEIGQLTFSELEGLLDTQCSPPSVSSSLGINGIISKLDGCGLRTLTIVNTGSSVSSAFDYDVYVNGQLSNSVTVNTPLGFLESIDIEVGTYINIGDELEIILNYADDNLLDNTMSGIVGSDLNPITNRFRVEYELGPDSESEMFYFGVYNSSTIIEPLSGSEELGLPMSFEHEFYLDEGCWDLWIEGFMDETSHLYLINLDEFGEPIDTLYKILPYGSSPGDPEFMNVQTIYEPEYEACVFLDENENGDYDEGEQMISGVEIEIEGQLVYTTMNGCVTLPGAAGGQLVSVNQDELVFPTVTTLNPTELTHTLQSNYFGLSANEPHYNLNSELTLFATIFCNNNSQVRSMLCNDGNVPADGEYTLEIDPLLTPLSANHGGVINGNTVTWTIENLPLGQCLFLRVILESPDVELFGEMVTYSSTTTTFDDLGNTVSVENQGATGTILCAFDPNDKQVWPAGETEAGYIQNGTELEYMIRFQNTGNAPATNVRVDDDLDTDLDWQSFELISTSHYCEPSINTENGHVEFYFPDIMLPDSTNNEPESHGFIRYKVSLQPDREEGTPVENTAFIYFDFNPAVVTNTTLNTVSDLYFGIESAARKQLVMYPNPTSNSLLIELGEIKGAFTLNLYSAMGSLVKSEKMNASNQLLMSVNDYPAGMYTLEIIPDSDSQDVYMGRFVKQ